MGFTEQIGYTDNLPTMAGLAFAVGGTVGSTPLLAKTGVPTLENPDSINRKVQSQQFVMSNTFNIDAPGESRVRTEAAARAAVASETVTPTQYKNQIQLWRSDAEVTDLAASEVGRITSGLSSIFQGLTITSDDDFQMLAKILQLANDWEWSMFNGTGTVPSTSATKVTMSGIITAVTTAANTYYDAGTAGLDKDLIHAAIQQWKQYNQTFIGLEIHTSYAGIVALDTLYGNAPMSRTEGGTDTMSIFIPGLGRVTLVENPTAFTGTGYDDRLCFVNTGVVTPAVLANPRKGGQGVYFEDLAKDGASEKKMLYAQHSVDFGSPDWHMVIDNITF